MIELNSVFSVLAGSVLCLTYLPYGLDIKRGRVQPARSARLMLTLVLMVALAQQHSLGSGWILAITIGELVGSLAILGMAIKYGVGGLSTLDKWCYGLLFVSLGVWVVSRDGLLALHMTMIVDFIAFLPTLVKTWRLPTSETPLFFIAGATMPLLSLIGLQQYSYAILAFPLYLAFINAVEVALIYKASPFRRSYGSSA